VKGLQPELESVTSGPLARFKKALTMQESRAGSEGLRVLRTGMTDIAAQALGTTGAVGKIGESFLSLGIGGPWGLAALGGIAAVGVAMRAFGDESVDAAKRTQEAMAIVTNALKLPKFGQVADDLAAVGLELTTARDRADALRAKIADLANQSVSDIGHNLQRELEETTTQIQKLEQTQDRLIDQMQHRLTPAQELARAASERATKQIQAASEMIEEQRARLEALQYHWGPAKLAGRLVEIQSLYAGLGPQLAAATGQMASQVVVLEQLTKNFNALQLLRGLSTRAPAQLQPSRRAFAPAVAETSPGGEFDPANVALALQQAAELAQGPLERLRTEFGDNVAMLQRFRDDLAKGFTPDKAIADLEAIAGKADRIRELAEAFRGMGDAIASIGGVNAQKMLAPLAVVAKVYAAFELAQGIASLASAIFGVGGPNPQALAAASKHFQSAAQFGSIGGGGSGGGGGGGGGGAGSIATGGGRLGVTRPTQESAGTMTVVFPKGTVFNPTDPDQQDAFVAFLEQVQQRNVVIRN